MRALMEELEKMGEAVFSIPPYAVLFLVMLQVVTMSVILFQWHSLAKGMGMNLPFIKLIHVHMSGTFIEGITPSVKAGGEAAKILLLKGCGINAGAGTALVLLQKAASLIVFLALNLFAAAALYFTGIRGAQAFIRIGLLFLMLFSILPVLILSFPQKCARILSILPIPLRLRRSLQTAADQVWTAVRAIPSKKVVLGAAALLSVLIWAIYGFKAVLVGQALGFSAGVFPLVVTAYLAYMAGMIPLLPGGIGAFEGAGVLLLSAQGVSVPQALVFSLILRGITFWMPFLLSALYTGLHALHRLCRRFANEACGSERGP